MFSPAREHHLGQKTKEYAVFKISAGPQTLTGKIWVGTASFPSLSYVNFGKIVLRSAKFQISFWRLNATAKIDSTEVASQILVKLKVQLRGPEFLRKKGKSAV